MNCKKSSIKLAKFLSTPQKTSSIGWMKNKLEMRYANDCLKAIAMITRLLAAIWRDSKTLTRAWSTAAQEVVLDTSFWNTRAGSWTTTRLGFVAGTTLTTSGLLSVDMSLESRGKAFADKEQTILTIPDDFIVYLLGVFASAAGLAEFYRRKILAEVEETNSHQQIIDVLQHVQQIESRLNEVAKQPNYTNLKLEKDIQEIKQLISQISPTSLEEDMQDIRTQLYKTQETLSLLERRMLFSSR